MPMSAVAKLAITAAMMAAQVAMTAMQRFKGPRLEDLNVTLAEYGTPIPRFWGIRRINPQIMWAEKLREKKIVNKTKGGKYSEYKYYGTWAVLICDHEIDGVARIWMDKHLVYQRKDAGPVAPVMGLIEGPFGIELKLVYTTNMRIYLGTETQEPDPRMEAWCEDRYGADSCPAYRGSAYIVFQDIPLEKFGNRVPQVTVEAVNGIAYSFPFESHVRESDLTELHFSHDFSRIVAPMGGDGTFEVWDTASRSKLFTANLPTDEVRVGIGVVDGGGFWAVSGFPSQSLYFISPTGSPALVTTTFDAFADGAAYVGNQVLLYPFGGVSATALYYGGGIVNAVAQNFIPNQYFEDAEGEAFASGKLPVGTGFAIGPMPEGPGVIVASGLTGEAFGMDNGKGSYVVFQNGTLFLVSKATMMITASEAVVTGVDPEVVFRNLRPASPSIWFGAEEYSTTDLSLIQTVTYSDWTAEDVDLAVYDPVNHALICQPQIIMNYTWRFLNRFGSDGVTLKTVVDDVSAWCGLTTQDTTALTQTVDGYSGTQGIGKEWIAPLLELHDVDPRPHDFSVQFVNRGGSPSGSILTSDFVREGDEARYLVSIKQDTDLPRRITFTFADKGKDQQANTVISQRELDAVDSNREESIDLTTYVDTPDLAQQKADRFFRREWNSRETITNALTIQKIALEPADVTTLSLDGVLRNARLVKMTLSGLRLNCEFVRDETSFAALNTATTGAPMEGRDPEVIYIPDQTSGFVIDGPLAYDADNDVNPIIYLAAGSHNGTWPGAVAMRGDDGTYDEVFTAFDSSSGATWGIVNDVLATANPNLWDRGNSFNATVFGGTPTSVTEAEIDADPALNLFAIGANGRWEYIQFATATLEGDGTYTFSILKRGRRGTEWAVGLHAIGDQFVELADATAIELGTDELGNDMSFKIQSVGRNIDDAFAHDLTYTGASLKPYAPAVQSVTKDPATGDILVDFDRRTRVGGNWNGTTIPLGEDSEAYELDVLDGADVARTLTATTTEFTYTAAQQTTDFGSEITAAALDAMLYQMSATVGRGFAATV